MIILYINNNNNFLNIFLINIFYILRVIISLISIFRLLLKSYKININLKSYIFIIKANFIINFLYYNSLFVLNIIYKL